MDRRIPLAAVLATVGLAACGIGLPGQAQHPRPSPSINAAQAFHNFAQCVRDHGEPGFPDPSVDAQGHAQFPDGVTKPADAIMTACGQLLPNSDKVNSSHPDPQLMLRFAQCMRANGIADWPDPDAQGRFRFPPSLGGGDLKTGPRWPQIQAAWSGPCARYDPSGHIEGAP
jgi:hypothetical protein